ncbi:MAG TPA: hypothetical protein VL749_05290 [Patescibacteria group bacterium]|nr:hypothetical protein [Patescibacteria group bacterium]
MRALSLAASLLVATLAACSAAGAPTPTPVPTVRPTPTPIVARVSSPADAAALVIATNPIFSGTMELRPDVIGASRWWTATALPSGGYRVELTIGWGDCMAGCIERHVWTFDVDANGAVKLVSETGDSVPSDLPA